MKAETSATTECETHARALELINAHLISQAIHVAADLGVADLIVAEPQDADALARATGTHARSLERMLRLLASLGVFREDEQNRFSLTPLSALLRRDVAGSVRDWALFTAAPELWAASSNLIHSVRTGESAFAHLHGLPLYDYLASHAELRETFDRMLTSQSEQHNAAVVASYDFSTLRTLVDVGGGLGGTLSAIVRAFPSLHGVLFDFPKVVAQAMVPQEPTAAARFTAVGGDARHAVPLGGDGYLLKRVLCDKSDEEAVTILRQCVAAMAPAGCVLVVEPAAPPRNEVSVNTFLDLLFLVCFGGGRVRREMEWRELLTAAGLTLVRIYSDPTPNCIMVATPTGRSSS